MTFRADVIGWKTNHYPDITTRAGQITNWPVGAPFPEPDQATHDIWVAEYQAAGVEQRAQDIVALLEAGKDIALVLVELIEWTLDNTAMQPADFSADVKQSFLDIQAIADRLRTP